MFTHSPFTAPTAASIPRIFRSLYLSFSKLNYTKELTNEFFVLQRNESYEIVKHLFQFSQYYMLQVIYHDTFTSFLKYQINAARFTKILDIHKLFLSQ